VWEQQNQKCTSDEPPGKPSPWDEARRQDTKQTRRKQNNPTIKTEAKSRDSKPETRSQERANK